MKWNKKYTILLPNPINNPLERARYVKVVDIIFDDEAHFETRRDRFAKKHEDEVSQAIKNFENAMSFFENSNVEQLRYSGLARREKDGVLAVDQRGSKRKPPYLIRLYFYPWQDEQGKHCMVLTMGEKKRQQEDNNYCIERLRKRHLK